MQLQLSRPASGRLQSQQDGEGDGSMRAQVDGACANDAGADAGDERSLAKFSLKLEDMPSSTLLRTADRWRTSFRRSKTPPQQARAPLQKTYSQYNLTQLSSTIVDESHHKPLHGVYGLLARHIEVPPSVWEKLQPQGAPTREQQRQQWSAGLGNRKGALRDAVAAAAAARKAQQQRRRPSVLGLPLLHPYSRLAVAWRCAMLLFDLTFTAFWVPLNIGFCFTSYGDLGRPCTRSDLAGGIVYVLNWVMGFQMGVVATSGHHKRVVVLDGISVARVYVTYGKFVMDTLAAVPFFVLVSAIASPHDGPVSPGRRLWSLLALLRLVRLLRLFNTVKVVYKDSVNGHYRSTWVAQRISVPLMYLLILGYQFLVVINLCASLMILLATYYGAEGVDTWFAGLKWVDFTQVSPPLLWYHSAYWVITVLTTTGQGQAPRQLGEQIVSNFCSVYGMVFNGLVVGVVGEALMRASGDASALLRSRRNVARATDWAALRHLRPSLTRDLQLFFADSELAHRDAPLARRDFNKEAAYIEDLPTSLRRNVLQIIVQPLLSKVPFLQRMDPELRALLASMFRPVDVPRNHDLCRQGTAADRLWVVEWGTVVALRHKEAEAHPTTGVACLLGEGCLLRGCVEAAAARPWTLRTTSVCRLWELHCGDLERLLRVEPSLMGDLLQYVKERLIFKLDGVPERDASWCELVAVLGRTLKQPHMLDAARDNLEALVQSRVDDGSLALLLSAWLEAGIATSLELGLGTGAARRRDLVTMSLMLARQSNDAGGGPGGPINSYGSAFHYPLASPSPAIMSRYGSGARGGGGGGGGALHRMSNSNAWGPLGSSGGGGGGGGPTSPMRVVPSVSPAMLRQPSGGGEPTLRSPGPSEELPPGFLLAAGGSGGGGGGAETEPGGGRPRPKAPAIAKRSRSFSHGSKDDDGSEAAAAAAAAGAVATTLTSPPSYTQSQPQVSIPLLGGSSGGAVGIGGSGRAAPTRSRFAAAAAAAAPPPPRPAPWVEAVAMAAAAASLRDRQTSGRASFSEDGVAGAASSRGDGDGDGGWGAVLDAAAAADSGRPDLTAAADAAVGTQWAYTVVDAGGVPQHPPPPPQQQPTHGPRGSPLLPPGRPQPPQLQRQPSSQDRQPVWPSPHRPKAFGSAASGGGGGGAVATAYMARSGSSGEQGGVGGGSPRLGGGGGSGGSGGGGSPSHGSAAGAPWPSVVPALPRTRSAQTLLPLVPEDEGAARGSADGAGAGATAAPAAPPPALPVPVPAARFGRHRPVSRSRSASLLGQRNRISALLSPSQAAAAAVVAAPSLPRVREEGTASGSGAAAGDVAAAAAAAGGHTQLQAGMQAGWDPTAAAAATTDDTSPFGTGDGFAAAAAAAATTGDSFVTAAGLSSSLAAAPMSSRISAVSPAAAAMAAAAAAAAGVTASGGEISGAPISDRLSQLQLPMPDRVSKLRVRTGTPPPAAPAAGRLSYSNADGGGGVWALSPVVLAAGISGGGAASISGGGGGGGSATCPAASLCVTCGRCTCAACRARALATAAAVEQGAAAVVPAAGGTRAPYTLRPSAAAATRGSAGAGPGPGMSSLEALRGGAGGGGGGAAGQMYGNAAASTAGRTPGISSAAPWARGGVGGGAAGRGPETWRRRRVSMVLDLSMPSVPLVPY